MGFARDVLQKLIEIDQFLLSLAEISSDQDAAKHIDAIFGDLGKLGLPIALPSLTQDLLKGRSEIAKDLLQHKIELGKFLLAKLPPEQPS